MRENPFVGKGPKAMWGTRRTAKKRAKKVHWLKEQQAQGDSVSALIKEWRESVKAPQEPEKFDLTHNGVKYVGCEVTDVIPPDPCR